MKDILLKHFGIEALEIKKLAGYENVNYLVMTHDAKYIFKTYKPDEPLFDLVKAESEVLVSLTQQDNNLYPKPLKTIDGEYVQLIEVNGEKTIIRLLSFLEGNFLAETQHTPTLFTSFGEFLGNMNVQLAGFKNYTIQARQFEWDIQYVYLNK